MSPLQTLPDHAPSVRLEEALMRLRDRFRAFAAVEGMKAKEHLKSIFDSNHVHRQGLQFHSIVDYFAYDTHYKPRNQPHSPEALTCTNNSERTCNTLCQKSSTHPSLLLTGRPGEIPVEFSAFFPYGDPQIFRELCAYTCTCGASVRTARALNFRNKVERYARTPETYKTQEHITALTARLHRHTNARMELLRQTEVAKPEEQDEFVQKMAKQDRITNTILCMLNHLRLNCGRTKKIRWPVGLGNKPFYRPIVKTTGSDTNPRGTQSSRDQDGDDEVAQSGHQDDDMHIDVRAASYDDQITRIKYQTARGLPLTDEQMRLRAYDEELFASSIDLEQVDETQPELRGADEDEVFGSQETLIDDSIWMDADTATVVGSDSDSDSKVIFTE